MCVLLSLLRSSWQQTGDAERTDCNERDIQGVSKNN